MKHAVVALMLAVVMVGASGAGRAGDQEKKGGTKPAVKTGAIMGTVVDAACQILGEAPGPGHKGCAEGGVPVGIVDDHGKLWLAINGSYGSATPLLVPFMGQRVRAEGWYLERKGERLIAISKVEAVKPQPGAADALAKKERWVCPHACGGKGDKAGTCPNCGLTMVKEKP